MLKRKRGIKIPCVRVDDGVVTAHGVADQTKKLVLGINPASEPGGGGSTLTRKPRKDRQLLKRPSSLERTPEKTFKLLRATDRGGERNAKAGI